MFFTNTVIVTCYYCINSCIAEYSPYLQSRNNIHDKKSTSDRSSPFQLQSRTHTSSETNTDLGSSLVSFQFRLHGNAAHINTASGKHVTR